MQLVIHPPVESERLDRIAAAAGPMAVVNAGDEEHVLRHMPDADALFGKLTPRLLAAAAVVGAGTDGQPRALTVPELAALPCVLAILEGLPDDTVDRIREKERRYAELVKSDDAYRTSGRFWRMPGVRRSCGRR